MWNIFPIRKFFLNHKSKKIWNKCISKRMKVSAWCVSTILFSILLWPLLLPFFPAISWHTKQKVKNLDYNQTTTWTVWRIINKNSHKKLTTIEQQLNNWKCDIKLENHDYPVGIKKKMETMSEKELESFHSRVFNLNRIDLNDSWSFLKVEKWQKISNISNMNQPCLFF